MKCLVNNKDVGGYTTFDDAVFVKPNQTLLPADKVKLFALGRHCLEAVCRSVKPKWVHLPLYTCASVKNVLAQYKIKVNYYSLKDNLTPDIPELADDELLLVNNYFGLLNEIPSFCTWLDKSAPPFLTLIDNTHSLGIANQFPGYLSFISPRKFLPVTDGGILYDEFSLVDNTALPDKTDISWNRMSWLFRAIDENGRNQSYAEYLQYRKSIQHIDYSNMSAVTRHLLSLFDIPSLIKLRNDNFMQLKKIVSMYSCFNQLSKLNEFSPIGYPAYAKNSKKAQKSLGEQQIYTIRYWPELCSENGLNDIERDLLEHLLILPINRPIGDKQLSTLMDGLTVQ